MDHCVPHVSVLYDQVLLGLHVVPDGQYVDCTIGAGGHAQGILNASSPGGRLLGLDADPVALDISRSQLEPFKNRFILVHSNFVHVKTVAQAHGFGPVDGILFDLGVSSMQLDTPERGFSFQNDGPLDMRLDPSNSLTAAELVNTLSERELADLFFRYGEEPRSRAIARAVVGARPLRTTAQLADVVARAQGRRRGRSGGEKRHPATRVFQALRIAVNAELSHLENVLEDAVSLLKPGGRLAVITFHSLEDRIVKQFVARESRDCICPPEVMVCTCGHSATLVRETRKPIRPSEQEMASNPRSRSAKLRVASKR